MTPFPGAPLDATTLQDPVPFYAWLRADAPVYRVPDTRFHLVATWDLVTDAVARIDDLSSNLDVLLYTGDDGRPAAFDMAALGANVQTLATADPPAHTRHRRAVFPSLVERRMRAVEGYARAVAADLADAVAAEGRVDITRAFADPLPMTVLGEVLGLRPDDHSLDDLLAWAFDGTELLAGTSTLARMAELSERSAEAGAFLAGQLAATPPDPDAGVLGAIAVALRDEQLTPDEAIGTLVILLSAGGESTTSLVGSAVRILAADGELQATLRAEPELIPTFVEEVLRLETPFKGHYRIVRRPTPLGDEALEPGDAVFLLWGSANRDPEHYEAPDELRLDRPHPRDHLGFGRGIHHCVGAPLARMEARVALEELLRVTDHFTLDPDCPPAYVPSLMVRRHAHLHLVVEPASR